MFVRLFFKDGTFKDGELEYRDLGESVDEKGNKVQKFEMDFTEGLPQGILPTVVMRLEFEEG